MTRPGSNLPRATIDELPIPRNVEVDRTWTRQMREIAAVIGAYETLLLIDRFGGRQLYVPATAKPDHPISLAIGTAKARLFAKQYGSARLVLPVAKAAIARAKRAPIIAEVRAKRMSATEAARILRSSRHYVAELANHGDEAREFALPATAEPDAVQLDLLAAIEAAG